MKIRHCITPGVILNYTFFCPGCQCGHGFNIQRNKPNGRGGFVPVWQWNGDVEKPTIRASILVKHVKMPENIIKDSEGKLVLQEDGKIFGSKDIICHSFVTNGMIQFLSDSTHELSGQTVPLQDF